MRNVEEAELLEPEVSLPAVVGFTKDHKKLNHEFLERLSAIIQNPDCKLSSYQMEDDTYSVSETVKIEVDQYHLFLNVRKRKK